MIILQFNPFPSPDRFLFKLKLWNTHVINIGGGKSPVLKQRRDRTFPTPPPILKTQSIFLFKYILTFTFYTMFSPCICHFRDAILRINLK